MKNFWTDLNKPFFALAPMYDVTDEAFRQMFVKYGKPDVLFTEFVSVDGLVNEEGRKKVTRELYFQKNEHPIVAQVFGNNPEKFFEAAKIIAEMGFDGIDINMGCPDKTIIKQGSGSALIRKPDLAVEIIKATKAGAPNLPVSVKTRLGYSKVTEMENWLGRILEAQPAALTVHLRTTKEMSKVPAHWELAEKVAKMAKEAGVIVLANGDVETLEEAKEKAEKFGFDGIMIGRGVFGNPWFFANLARLRNGCQIEHPAPIPGQGAGTNSPALDSRSACPSGLLGLGYGPSLEEKLNALVEHTKLYEDLYCDTDLNKKLFAGHTKNFALMRKNYKAYVKGFRGATDLREKLMLAENAKEVEEIIKKNKGIVIPAEAGIQD
jgi:nifR3 family TIM-barrel protein